ncbi:MAG: hypothetical protein MUF49_23790 [Oculatellaceae cyanobacterium Prado106]|jgi:hypothetical protein|nr:hypothetical protein [Oculatellaceae cyanobacterium Prado106]
MNSIESSAKEEEAIEVASVTEFQHQLTDFLQRLSPERLRVLADFAAYLADTESEAATQELLAIPGLRERVQQNQTMPRSQHTNWRTLRSTAPVV